MNENELQKLWAAYAHSRSTDLRNALVEQYLPLSRSVARKFLERGLEREDLEQAAAMALIKAVEQFDSEKGFRFSTYAVPTIAGSLHHMVRDRNGTFRVSRDVAKLLASIDTERAAFEQREMRSPTPQELADIIGITSKELLSALYMRSDVSTFSMDAAISEDEENSLDQLLGAEDPGYANTDSSHWFQWMASHATEQERMLMDCRYQQGLNQRETAAKMGVSQMQISRIERRLIAKLRAVAQNS